MKKKIFLAIGALGVTLVTLPLFAAFEAHVINVTAKIENALFVHPQSLQFGTVFPQEYFESSFFIAFSESFSESSQQRVGKVDYAIKQKPKPREEYVQQVGVEDARDWCHENIPDPLYQGFDENQAAWDAFFVNCYPTLCPYLSKHPDGNPSTGQNADNDYGLPSFHNPELEYASGTVVKFNTPGNTIGNDPSDTWTVDLSVPCFDGFCAQDWADFVAGKNPDADPDLFMLPPELEHEVLGCDLWIEVTQVY
jgi:hypothetical protein